MKPALDDLFYEHPEYGRKSFQWHLLEAFFAPIAFLNRGMLLPAMVAVLIYAAFIAFLAGIAMLLVDTVPFGLSLSLIVLIPLAVLLACWADATIHRHIQKNGYRLSYRHFVPGERLWSVFVGRLCREGLTEDVDGFFVLSNHRLAFLPIEAKHLKWAFILAIGEIRTVKMSGKMPLGRLVNAFAGDFTFGIDVANNYKLSDTPLHTTFDLETERDRFSIYLGPLTSLLGAFAVQEYNNLIPVMNLNHILADVQSHSK